MADKGGKVESLNAHHLREFRAELKERDERVRAEIGRVHSDVGDVNSGVAQLRADLAKMHADVLATKSLALDAIVKLTNLESRVAALEPRETEDA